RGLTTGERGDAPFPGRTVTGAHGRVPGAGTSIGKSLSCGSTRRVCGRTIGGVARWAGGFGNRMGARDSRSGEPPALAAPLSGGRVKGPCGSIMPVTDNVVSLTGVNWTEPPVEGFPPLYATEPVTLYTCGIESFGPQPAGVRATRSIVIPKVSTRRPYQP